ncbi:flavodoxin family protein [Halobacillus litoralis]|uniref:NAD(P)H-dependent oxidoreductase n=1 Tax=Halobacillus litoralis TaxID=45668 RepID=A0A410M9M4_9BACI|nr:flavodoxin family protein [Halobacillus litoralis]QAS51425.1 NAD(P)H-dependent oxidoreductase [Halobacillus litoralis]
MKITVLYGSTRADGNTELLTEYALQGISAKRVVLKDYYIKEIVDQRHEAQGFSEVKDDYNTIIDAMLAADVLIFATPIYWYGMSSVMKTFIDRWSQTVRDEKYPNFKVLMSKKKAYMIAVGGDNPTKKGLPLIQQFKYICEFIGLNFQGFVLGEGVKPRDILEDKKALQEISQLNKQLKGLN